MRIFAAKTPTVTDWCLSQICDRWHNCCWTQWDWSRQSVAFFALCPALLEGHQLDDDFQKINLYFVRRGNAPQKQADCKSDHVMFYLIQQWALKTFWKTLKFKEGACLQRRQISAEENIPTKETKFKWRNWDKLLRTLSWRLERFLANLGVDQSSTKKCAP